MKIASPLSKQQKPKGIALIAVISVVAILTILTVAMLSLAQGERKSAVKYADGEFARSLADSAVNIAMGQIWEGTQNAVSNDWYIWASQPGAIRKYKSNGSFYRGYKLYSDDQMVVAGSGNGAVQEKAFSEDPPDAEWQKKTAQWVDLNEPVIRPDADGDNLPELIFPIVDPRAFIRKQLITGSGASQPNSTNIEGFSYESTFSGVIDAESVVDIGARLPMPVQWLYVLKDGSVGYMKAGGAGGNVVFTSASGAGVPSLANPIVGRLAFWTDDETSKLNINTASEPTYWSTPISYHDREYDWAIYQPTRFEYQRYPGHPATVALSTVLFPNRNMDGYGKSSSEKMSIRAMKERIYEIMPKINRGGSEAATVPFWASSDPTYKGTQMTRVDIANSLSKHLYASVDELLFSSTIQNGKRLTHDSVTGATPPLFTDSSNASAPNEERALERMRFFLTAHSRSPETNIFGQPRVAMWPVANETSIGQMRGDPKAYRTVFDNLVAFCNTLGAKDSTANSYFFRRADNMSPTHDFSKIERNKELLNYLYAVLKRPFPSGGNGNVSFVDKYSGGDAAQILTMIFDYIRCTNLYDGVLAPTRDELLSKTGDYWLKGSTAQQFEARDKLRQNVTKTFTADRCSLDLAYDFTNAAGVTERNIEPISYTAFPGHGQVAPIRATIDGNQTMGLGRFPAISEVGFHFICTADGNNDDGSFKRRNADGSLNSDLLLATGGRTAVKLSTVTVEEMNGNGNAIVASGIDAVTGEQLDNRWYSNFPPFPQAGDYGTNETPESPMYFKKHPGFRGRNWNVTLDRRKPLLPGVKQIQGMLCLELTAVAAGYTGIYPDMTIAISGLGDSLRVAAPSGPGGGRPVSNVLFQGSSSSKFYWRAPRSLFQTSQNREAGASVGPMAMTQGRMVAKRDEMPPDINYQPDFADSLNTYEGSANFELVTSFFPVAGNQMTFSGGNLTIEVYSGRNVSPEYLVQTYTINFPARTLPVPELVVLSTPTTTWVDPNTGKVNTQERVESPHWWAFNYGGAIGRFAGIYDYNDPIIKDQGLPFITSADKMDGVWASEGIEAGCTLGRFFKRGLDYGKRFGVPRFDSFFWANTFSTKSYPGGETYGKFMEPNALPTKKTASVGLLAAGVQGPFGQDVVISMVPSHGDIRHIAAKRDVPASDWELHPAASPTTYMAHSFMRFVSDYEEGINVGTDNNFRLVNSARYTSNSARPDYPPTARVKNLLEAQRWGDFDSGAGSMRDGPWINKPDEGNTGLEMKQANVSGAVNNLVRTPTAYYDEMYRSSEAGEAFLSPNRMVASPGMFGSLPTGVKRDKPWQTLLFRPWIPMPARSNDIHPGSPNYNAGSSSTDTSKTPYNGVNPADHYFMDLFWMPVVEPYAISEAFSTAGKLNLNYQIVPFNSYIRRATGLHAVLKAELISAYPTSNIGELHSSPGGSQYVPFDNAFGNYHYKAKWSDIASHATSQYYTGTGSQPSALRYWHRNIDIDSKTVGGRGKYDSTLGQFEDKFKFASTYPSTFGGLFRSASQICEMHLVPKKIGGSGPAEVESGATAYTDGSDFAPGTPYSYKSMADFWLARAATGDNVRERPYTNIYAKVTTQSNTYRVHFRAQAIRKARSVSSETFDPAVDSVTSDYRGSAVLERRIDPQDPRIPDYGKTPNAQPLDNFYNFRVLENKRFAP